MEQFEKAVAEGIKTWESSVGARCIRIHYTADEDKRSEEWKADAKKGYPEAVWEQEMEMNPVLFNTEPVFPEFHERFHAPSEYAMKDFDIVPNSLFVGGWDAGLSPAFVLIQLTPNLQQIQVLLEITAHNTPMVRFAPLVADKLSRMSNVFPVYHFGDPSIRHRDSSRGESPFDICRDEGILVRPSTNVWATRREAVAWALTDMISDRVPRMVINRKNCKVLIEGFKGLYRLRRSRAGDTGGIGAIYSDVPVKNESSHVQDALQYAVVAIREEITGVRKDDIVENMVRRTQVVEQI